jgi:hypothetical protein
VTVQYASRHESRLSARPKRRVKSDVHEVCAFCGEPRPEPKSFKYVPRAQWERDEFCSTVCARTFFGTLVKAEGYGIDYGATARKAMA